MKTEIKRIRKNRKDSDGFSLYTVFAFFIIRKEEFSNYFLMQEGRMRSVEKMKYAEMAYVKNPVSRIFFRNGDVVGFGRKCRK